MAQESSEIIEAARLGAVVTLSDVKLTHLKFEVTTHTADPPFKLEGDWNTVWDQQDNILVFRIGLELTARSKESGDVCFRADVAYLVGYELPADYEAVTPEAAEAFGSISARFAVHPYVRELLQSLTTRSGLPPLVLDVIRAPVGAMARMDDR